MIALAVSAALLASRAALEVACVQPVLNFTASAPRGVYLLHTGRQASPQRGEYVAFRVPPAFASYVYGRRWLRPGTPLLKKVAGIPGDELCVEGLRFTLNGMDSGPVSTRDSQGRPLPALKGCVVVQPGQFLPISTLHRTSFDGRYTGPLPVSLITGHATLLWTF